MQETWVQSLGWEDTLEKGMAIHSSILAWRNPWTEEPGWLQSIGSLRVGHDWATNIFTFHYVVNKTVITLYRDSGITRLIVWSLVMYADIKSLCSTPETNIILCVNYILLQREKEREREALSSVAATYYTWPQNTWNEANLNWDVL